LNRSEIYVIRTMKKEGIISYEWRIQLFDNIGQLLRDILYEDHLNEIYKRHYERKQISKD